MTTLVSLRSRLLRQFMLMGAIPVLLVSAIGFMLVAPVLETQAQERNHELAIALRDQMQLQLSLRQRPGSLIAAQLHKGTIAPERIDAALQGVLREDGSILAAYVVDRAGLVTHAAIAPESGRFVSDAIGADLSARADFRRAREGSEPVWSDTFLSTLTGQVTAVLTVPAQDNAVVVEFALAGLSQSLSDLARGGSQRAIVLDRLGRVIAHPDARMALRQENLASLPIVARAASGAPSPDRTTVLDGRTYFAHALPVGSAGWTVLAMQPVDVVMAPLHRVAWIVGALVAMVTAGAAGLSLFYARRTGREVVQLADGAQAAAAAPAAGVEPHFTTAEFAAVWTRLRELFRQLHQRDEQTRAARQELQAVLDAATEVAIIATDTAGLVTVFNVGAQRMLARKAADVIGRLTPEAWHDPAEVEARALELGLKYGTRLQGFDAMVSEARHGGYEVRDWTYLRADGRRISVSLAVTAVHGPQGHIEGFLGVAVDVTEQRRATALELERKTAERANQAKSEFLSRVSHELRSPLNAMLGYAQLIEISRQPPPTPAQAEYVQHIQRAGWHLVRLIDDVLDLSRIESGNVRVAIEPVDLRATLQRACELVAPDFERTEVRLSAPPGDDPHALPPVMADPTRLTQVLVNLLGNAAKYNRRGGHVEVSVEHTDRRVRLQVADTGRGMNDAQLRRLFQPFDRLGAETTGIPGTGIGLVITKRLVELMHGQLQVTSTVDVGSTFSVCLPAAAQPVAAAEVSTTAPPSVAADARGRVLYIEDSAVNAQLMRAVLRQRPDVDLEIADTMAGGLESMRRHRPDLVLLDMHLPDGNGADVLDALARDRSLSTVPVVVVSADATRQQIGAALHRGVRAYITKPINVAEVLAALDQVLNDAA